MAARKRNWQTNKTREKIRDSIKTGLLVNRFEKHALAQTEEERKATMLTSSQLKAGEILLQRTLPTLSSAEIVENDQPHGLDQAMDQLKQLVGPELANALSSKDGIKAIAALMNKNVKVEEVLIHDQPDQTQ